MATSTATFTMDSTLFGQLIQAACRRNGFVSGGNQLIVQMPPAWTAMIPDPAWQPLVNGEPNPTPQGQVANPQTQIQYVEQWLIYSVFGTVIDADIHAVGDATKIAADAAAEATNEATRAANVAAALAAKNALVPSVTVVVQ
jgi:hypothetical protein